VAAPRSRGVDESVALPGGGGPPWAIRNLRPILGGLILLLAAVASRGAEAPVLELKFVSYNRADGSYQIRVDNATRRIPSVKVAQDHHVPGTLYKVARFIEGYETAGKSIPTKDVSTLLLVHEMTGRSVQLTLGVPATVENPDARVPRFK
jgi:hypothetical protein